MIPEDAVEAAAKAAYEAMPVELFGRDHPVTWEQLSESVLGRVHKVAELAKARAALEAAAPFIADTDLMAHAWDEGERAGYENRGAEQWGAEQETNPYRKEVK